jgi:DNA-binding FadR family transcriptional regulator
MPSEKTTRGSTRTTVDELGDVIVSGRPYRPGDVISLEAVTQLGVSRAMAREVLQVLQQKRLVGLQPRVGATVLPVERWDVFDPDVIRWRLRIAPRFQMRSLTELREAIEPRAASLAAQRASADVCRDLISLSQQLLALGADPTFANLDETGHDHRQRYSEVDMQFHQTLLKGSGNEMFLALAEPVTRALEFRIAQDWAGAPDQHGAGGSGARDISRFPRRPQFAALWFHHGVAYAIDQGNAAAAEVFSSAILAEIHDGEVRDPVLRYALRHALSLLDLSGLPKDDRAPFEQAIRTTADGAG